MDDLVRAAGAVVWRPGPYGDVEVLLVHRPRYDDWSLPKGKAEPGEHVLATACREVFEETGHRVVLGRPLPSQRYLARGRPKLAQYWAARADDGAPDWEPTTEVDELAWCATWLAHERLTHPRDADVVRALTDGPPGTVPLVVLRHAEALPRKAWTGDDAERPLSEQGEEQAFALVPILAALGVRRVVSSDTVRCEATVAPYAKSAGVTVEHEPRISEQGHEARPEAAAEVVRELLADGEPTVLCSHRPVLPVLHEAIDIAAEGGVEVPSATLRTAALLIAHAARGRVVAAEAHVSEPL